MIGIVDYGLGNLSAFRNLYTRLNVAAITVKHAEDFKSVKKLILPGVGNFDNAIALLSESGIAEVLREHVRDKGVPVLGICVGMQILARSSEEGQLKGLDWIPGVVKRFRTFEKLEGLTIPHMGWNRVEWTDGFGLFAGMPIDPRFYFLHSYHFCCDNESHGAAYVEYGDRVCCAVQRDNVMGVQFHPEKSHDWGIKLLQNFADLNF